MTKVTSAVLGGTGSGGGVLGSLVGGFTTKPEWALGLALPVPLL